MKTTAPRQWYHHIPVGSQHTAGGFVSTSEDRKDTDAQVICHVHFSTKYGKLIAAAPELLEALKKVAQTLEWHAHGRCRGIDDGAPLPTNEAVDLAKRTIAKAIGRDD